MLIGRMSLAGHVPAEVEQAVVAAIREAEAGNRGEVRVHVERRCPGAADARARELFAALGMGATAEDTAVLLYVALDDPAVGVAAGAGISGAAEPGFWDAMVERILRGVREGDVKAGLVQSILRIGTLLRLHVPGDDLRGNELPDAITTS